MTSPSSQDPAWEVRIRQRAYELWEQRGRPIGSPEVDWFRAENEIDAELNPLTKLPLRP
ncbi:MAG: DUF2934 domain-containing protein [Candidatus Acidiferrales bacterium]